MSAQHTPGPWAQHLVRVQRDITGPNGQSIAYTRGAHWSGDRSEVEDFANALLISVAPELLADLLVAAKTLRNYEALHRAKCTEESTKKAEVNAALAARFEATIAKATGAAA